MHIVEQLKNLVTEPLKKYVQLLALFIIYHNNVTQQAIDIPTTYSEPFKKIINILQSKRKLKKTHTSL